MPGPESIVLPPSRTQWLGNWARLRVPATALFALFLLGITHAAEPTPPLATAIRHPAVEYPLWVSTQAAETAGALDSPQLFHPIAARRIRSIFDSTPVHGCYPVGPIFLERYGGRTAPTSLTQAARAYPVVALGRVISLNPGFLVGEPGTLITAEAEDSSRAVKPGSTFSVFMPVGELTFQGKRICKEDPRFAPLPKLGDEILLFSDPTEAKDSQYFAIEHPENLAVIAGDRVLYAPALARAADRTEALPSTRDELLVTLRQVVIEPRGTEP